MIRPSTLVVQLADRNGANSARSLGPPMARPQNSSRKKRIRAKWNEWFTPAAK